MGCEICRLQFLFIEIGCGRCSSQFLFGLEMFYSSQDMKKDRAVQKGMFSPLCDNLCLLRWDVRDVDHSLFY